MKKTRFRATVRCFTASILLLAVAATGAAASAIEMRPPVKSVAPVGRIAPGRAATSAKEVDLGRVVPPPGRIATTGRFRKSWRSAPDAAKRRGSFEDIDLTAEATGRSALPAGMPGEAIRERLTDLGRLTARGGALNRPTAAAGKQTAAALPWNADHLLADATNMDDEYVSIVASPVSANLYAVFEATDLGGTDRDIHIARSTDNGATWQVWEMPSFVQDEYHPEIAVDAGGYLLVTWIRADGYILRAKTTNTDDPTLWAWVKGLSVGETCATPSIAVKRQGTNGKVFIAAAWYTMNYDLLAYEWTLIWMYSTDGGVTVQYDYFLPDGYNDYWPDVALKGATCYFINAEQDYYTGEMEILAVADNLSGSFLNAFSLTAWTAMDCRFPVVANQAENVYIAYQLDFDDGLGNVDGDIIYSYSWDGLTSVYGPFEMVADTYQSVGPAIFTKGGVVGCLWLDALPGGDQFELVSRQAGGFGHPDFWGAIETVSDQQNLDPTFHSAFGVFGDSLIHAAWIDRRDFPTQGLNVYTSERTTEPNLAPFTPAGWGGPLVAGMARGDRVTGYLKANDTTFVSFAFINGGLSDIAVDFQVRFTVDGALDASWTMQGGVPVNSYVTVEDHPVIVGAGPHVLAFDIDPLFEVGETDEGDNSHADTLIFIDGDPALRFNPNGITHIFSAPPLGRAGAMRLAADPPVRRETRMEAVGPRLKESVMSDGNAMRRVILVPAERVDVPALTGRLSGAALPDRRDAVRSALRVESEKNRRVLRGVWNALVAAGSMTEPEALWMTGVFSARMNAAAVDALSRNPSVARLWLDDRPLEPMMLAGGNGADRNRRILAAAWHLARTGVDSAWALGYDGTGIVIGHLDSGAAYDHPDLAGHLWDGSPAWPNHGYDAVDEDNDPYDGDTQFYHGTHTAGLIVGDGTSGTITGVAPGAKLMLLRCMPGTFTDLAEALQFAMDNGADLLSLSAGWINATSDLREGNRYNATVLLAAGIPWVCAAGNGDNAGGHLPVPADIASPADSPDPWYGTAGHTAVISVGATTAADEPWTYSSHGPTEWNIDPSAYGFNDYPYPPGLVKPDVAAPGEQITSTTPPAAYVSYDGTSMATPQVAGACAILLQASPGATPSDLARALESSTLDIAAAPASPGRDNYAGAGLIDIPAALALLPTERREILYVCNDGPLPLNVDGAAWSESWLSVTPLSASIAPGDSLLFSVLLDSVGLSAGMYTDDVLFTSNDPASPHALPVTLFMGEPTGVVGDAPPPPSARRLESLPNPFNPVTVIRFETASRGKVNLSIYTAAGRLVRTLMDGIIDGGSHEVEWNGRDDSNRSLASGIYLATLETEGSTRVNRKLTLLR